MIARNRGRSARLVYSALIVFLVSMLCGSLLIVIAKQSPLHIYSLLLSGTLGSGYGIGQVLFKVTPLLFCGLSVAFALRAGLFNVGAEGQLVAGAFCCAIVGAALPSSTPRVLAIGACLSAAFIGGAFVGLIAGALKAYRGAHEVIVTIMLNFIVRACVVGTGRSVFERESVHTAPVIANAWLPPLSRYFPSFAGAHVSVALFLALAVCVAVHLVFMRTRLGFALRAIGVQSESAVAFGVSWRGGVLWAMGIAGGLAGLGASGFVLGFKHYYEDGFSGGVGFMGIAVAILAGGYPLALLSSALLLGVMSQGALAINARVPKELVDVLQAVVIIVVSVTVPEVRKLVARRRGGVT